MKGGDAVMADHIHRCCVCISQHQLQSGAEDSAVPVLVQCLVWAFWGITIRLRAETQRDKVKSDPSKLVHYISSVILSGQHNWNFSLLTVKETVSPGNFPEQPKQCCSALYSLKHAVSFGNFFFYYSYLLQFTSWLFFRLVQILFWVFYRHERDFEGKLEFRN